MTRREPLAEPLPLVAPAGVELRLRATIDQIPLVRSVAASMVMRADFDIDDIADIRMLVDEVAATLIQRAIADTVLLSAFQIEDHRFTLHATVLSDIHSAVAQDTFGWRVLSTLSDELSTWTAVPSGDTPLREVHLKAMKARSRSDQP